MKVIFVLVPKFYHSLIKEIEWGNCLPVKGDTINYLKRKYIVDHIEWDLQKPGIPTIFCNKDYDYIPEKNKPNENENEKT